MDDHKNHLHFLNDQINEDDMNEQVVCQLDPIQNQIICQPIGTGLNQESNDPGEQIAANDYESQLVNGDESQFNSTIIRAEARQPYLDKYSIMMICMFVF